jgi:hypothetical protein
MNAGHLTVKKSIHLEQLLTFFFLEVLEFPFCKKVAEELKELLAEKFLLQCKEESEDQEKESKSKPIDEITDDEL